MAVLEPKYAILDEIDSGLDIDALQIVAKGINTFSRRQRTVDDYALSENPRLYRTRSCSYYD